MNRGLLLCAMLALVPLAELDAQRTRQRSRRAQNDSSTSTTENLMTVAGYGTGLLGLFVYDEIVDAVPTTTWCLADCEQPRRSADVMAIAHAGRTVWTPPADADEREMPLRKVRRTVETVETIGAMLARDGFAPFGPEDRAHREREIANAFGDAPVNARVATTPLAPATELSLLDEANCRGSACGAYDPPPVWMYGGSTPEALFKGGPAFDEYPTLAPNHYEVVYPETGSGPVHAIVNPEPGSVLLMIAGLGGLVVAGRRARRQR